MSAKDLSKLGLTPARAAMLVRWSRAENGRATAHSERRETIAALVDSGYIAEVPACSPEKINEIEVRRDNGILDARKALCDENDWETAYALLHHINALNREAKRTEHRLTEKGFAFARNHALG